MIPQSRSASVGVSFLQDCWFPPYLEEGRLGYRLIAYGPFLPQAALAYETETGSRPRGGLDAAARPRYTILRQAEVAE